MSAFKTLQHGLNAMSVDDSDAVRASLERARVVGVLDGWAHGVQGPLGTAGYCVRYADGYGWRVEVNSGRPLCGPDFYSTPDAARKAAADAIERGDV